MDRQKILGDTTRSELHSPSPTWPVELHGRPEAAELESPDNTPKVAQEKFEDDTSKQQAHDLGVTVDRTAR